MGRITKSFRMQFKEVIRILKKYRDALVDAGHREAFNSLLRVWSSTQGAMSYANIPFVLDAMLVAAVIDNRRMILNLFDQVGLVNSKLNKIQKRIQTFLL